MSGTAKSDILTTLVSVADATELQAVPAVTCSASDDKKHEQIICQVFSSNTRQMAGQRTVAPLSSKTSIEQLVRSIPVMADYQLQSNVVEALREASEACSVQLQYK